MSPKAINPGEGQFSLFNQPEVAEPVSITKINQEAVLKPEATQKLDKESAKLLGSIPTSQTSNLETNSADHVSPIKVDLAVRREAMLAVVDALDDMEANEAYSAAVALKTDPKKPSNYAFNKFMHRKKSPMKPEDIYTGAKKYDIAKEKADTAFDVMWGRDVVESHGHELQPPIKVRQDVSAIDVALLHHFRDKEGYGRIVRDGLNVTNLELADGTIEEVDHGRVIEEGFVKKYTSGDHLNPAVPDRMTPVTKVQAKAKRSKLRKELKPQIATDKKFAKQQVMSNRQVSARMSKAEIKIGIKSFTEKAKSYISGDGKPPIDYRTPMSKVAPGIVHPRRSTLDVTQMPMSRRPSQIKSIRRED